MAKKYFTDESLQTFVDETKAYTDNAVSDKADADHKHAISDVTNLQTSLDGKSNTDHTHSYAGSSSAGGAATSANKVNKSLTVQLNGGSTEGTNKFTFNGSAVKTVNITPSGIGAAASSHTHDDRYYTETEIDTKLSNKADKSHAHAVTDITDLTATVTELNYMDGVTSGVQAQLDGKVPTTRKINNKALSADVTLAASDVGAAPTSHNHSASNITSGILAVARGGTGNNSGYVRIGAEAGTTIGTLATAEGRNVTASGSYCHAEGNYTEASGSSAHAEGQSSTASGIASHAEGNNATASGNYSHAEGDFAAASGKGAHAEGTYTLASSKYQHVQGKFNIEDKNGDYAHIVGNGTGTSARSNAHTLDWDGNTWFAGDVYVGGTSQNNGVKLAKLTETPSLTQGDPIANGTDLNTITTIGNYRCSATADAESLTNCPCIGYLFTMRVGHLPNNPTYLYQEIIKWSDGTRYYRRKNGASANWSEWVESFDSADIIPVKNGGTGASTAAGARTNLGFTYGTSNPTTAPSTGAGAVYFKEFNRIEEIDSLLRVADNTAPSEDTPTAWETLGTLQCYYNNNSTIINKPTTYGTLLSFANSVKVVQIWLRQGYGHIYIRGGNSTGWNGSESVSGADAWKRVYDSSSTIPLLNGGTGRSFESTPNNAIVRKGADVDYLYYTPTGNGAFYAEADNGSPKFGTLPRAQGGTGYTYRYDTVSTTKNATYSDDAYVASTRYYPYLDMCFTRQYHETAAALTAGTAYHIATITADYAPSYQTALTVDSFKNISAYIDNAGKIYIRPRESVAANYAVKISGWWTKG